MTVVETNTGERSLPMRPIPPLDELERAGTRYTYEQIGQLSEADRVEAERGQKVFPFEKKEAEIAHLLTRGNPIAINGEPGSGKTYGMVRLMDRVYKGVGRAIMTEPRIDLTLDVARKMTATLGHPVGHITRDLQGHTNAGVIIMTDGVAVARLFNKKDLFEDVVAIEVDEVNQMNGNIILILSQLPDLQRRRADAGIPPIQLIVSSARLNKQTLGEKFPDMQFVDIPGRAKEIDIYWHDRPVSPNEMAEEIALKLLWAITVQKWKGRAIVFLPGKAEIEAAARAFRSYNVAGKNIREYHGGISAEEARKILDKASSDSDDIIFMTEKGAVGLDLDADIVIASGLVNRTYVDQATGREILVEEYASQEELDQMRGRTSRVTKKGAQIGKFLPMYTKEMYQRFPEFRRPEILGGMDIAPVILRLLASGVKDLNTYHWFIKPEEQAIQQALSRLHMLGVINDQLEVTQIGRDVLDLDVELKMGVGLMIANQLGVGEHMATIAAMAEVFPRLFDINDANIQANLRGLVNPQDRSDFIALLRVYDGYEAATDKRTWLARHGMQPRDMDNVKALRKELLAKVNGANPNRKYDAKDRAKLDVAIGAGFMINLVVETDNGFESPFFQNAIPLVRNRNTHANRFDQVAVSASTHATYSNTNPTANLIHPLSPETLAELNPQIAEIVKAKLAAEEAKQQARLKAHETPNTAGAVAAATPSSTEQTERLEKQRQEAVEQAQETARVDFARTAAEKSIAVAAFEENRRRVERSQKQFDGRDLSEALNNRKLREYYLQLFKDKGITNEAELRAALDAGTVTEADLLIPMPDPPKPLPPRREKDTRKPKVRPGIMKQIADLIEELRTVLGL